MVSLLRPLTRRTSSTVRYYFTCSLQGHRPHEIAHLSWEEGVLVEKVHLRCSHCGKVTPERTRRLIPRRRGQQTP